MADESKIARGLGWKLLERFGVQGAQFILQLVLARILDPEHYGTLSMMVIFTSLATVFIQTGFNTALVQNKDVTEDDYSTVWWITIGIAVILYIVIFLCAPLIGAFYHMPDLVTPLRVLSLILLPGTYNSIQLSITSRNMDFKKVFYSNVAAIVIAGVSSIILALRGAGLWALVAQSLLNTIVACIVMHMSVQWRPKLVCNWSRAKVLFSYGWKLLASGLLETLFQNINSLVIGKKYDTGTLGYYNRGQQFPSFVITAINGAVQSVLLPAIASEQDDRERVKALARNSVMLSSYIIFPMMAGLAGVATPLVRLLLTDKWLPCVPYLQIACLIFAFYPVHTTNLQAINAIGRSDIFLKLEIIKKTLSLVALVIAVFCFQSPMAIALSTAIMGLISTFINAMPNKKLIGYAYSEQMKDILPSLLASAVMCGCVLLVETLSLPTIVTLILQILVGIAVYIGISAVCRLKPFVVLLHMLPKGKNR